MAKPKKNRYLPYIVIVGVLVAAGLLAAVLLSGKDDEAIEFDQSRPGAARDGFILSGTAATDRLMSASQRLLMTDQGFCSWVRIADRLTGQPAEPASEFRTMDQIASARIDLEQGNRDALLAGLIRIRSYFMIPGGLPGDRIILDADGKMVQPSSISTAATLSWLRLLAESYSLTGDPALLDELMTASNAFLDMTDRVGMLPADSRISILKEPPRADPAATPTIRPSVTPTPEVVEERLVIRLSDIDLYALKLLVPLDPRWQDLHDRCRTILSEAVQSAQVPLFAFAYDPEVEDYVWFTGNQPLVSMEDTLQTLMHLYEAGVARPDTLTYIRTRFYEDSAIYEQVHRATGNRSGEAECITGYAFLARIARMNDNPILYDKTVARLSWHIATNTRSSAYGAVFRTDPDNRVRVSAADNLLAMLAFR